MSENNERNGNYLSKEAFEGYQRLYEERFSNDSKKLDKLEENQQKIQELTIQMAEVLKTLTDANKTNDERLNDLEKKPVKRYDTIISTVLTVILSGVISTIISFIVNR